MVLTHALRAVLHGQSPHQRLLERLDDPLVQPVAKVLHRARPPREHHRVLVVRVHPPRLGVDPDQVEVLPDSLQESIQVPLLVRGNRTVMFHLIQQTEFLHGDLVNLVDGVDARDVHAAALDDVDEVLVRAVVVQLDVRVLNPVLRQDLLHGVFVQVSRLSRVVRGEVDAALLLGAVRDLRRRLVQADPESLELVLDQAFVRQGLERVEHDDDDVAGSGG